MKVELDDNAGVSLCLISLMICATVASLVGCHTVELTKRKAMESGLVQKSEPGQTYPVWGKPE